MTLLEVFCHIDDFCQTFQIPTPKLSLPVLDKAAPPLVTSTLD